MEINAEIYEALKEMKIYKPDGICYLLSMYFGDKPTFIPDDLKRKMNLTGIYEVEEQTIKWIIPLFEGQEIAFDWVAKEYIPMFKAANPKKSGHVREALTLIKALFVKNPEVRKDDVLAATRLYIANTNPTYLMLPHYFIQKGRGVEKTTTILDWLDKVKEVKESGEGRTSVTNTMQ